MQLRMELEMRTNELSVDLEQFNEHKNMKKDREQAQLQERKAQEEVIWLKKQLADQKVKLKQANEDNDSLQDKLLSLKSNYMNRQSQESPGEPSSQGLQEFERKKMQ